MRMLNAATSPTPTPNESWVEAKEAERLLRVVQLTSTIERFRELLPTQARPDGQVFVQLRSPLSAATRGVLLRDYEAYLKQMIDPAIAIWVEPLGDKNSLRKLRGIQIKPYQEQ